MAFLGSDLRTVLPFCPSKDTLFVHRRINCVSLIRKIFHSSGLQRNFISIGFKTKGRLEALVQLCEDFILLPIEVMKPDLQRESIFSLGKLIISSKKKRQIGMRPFLSKEFIKHQFIIQCLSTNFPCFFFFPQDAFNMPSTWKQSPQSLKINDEISKGYIEVSHSNTLSNPNFSGFNILWLIGFGIEG